MKNNVSNGWEAINNEISERTVYKICVGGYFSKQRETSNKLAIDRARSRRTYKVNSENWTYK